MCRVNFFCCGCSLVAGAITASVFQGLTALGFLIAAIQAFVASSFLRLEDPRDAEGSTIGVILSASSMMDKNVQTQFNENNERSREDFRRKWIESREQRLLMAGYTDIIGGILMAITIVCIIILVCLVISIIKKSAPCVLPWLIGNMIKIVLNCIFAILILIAGFWLGLLFVSIPLGLELYLWIVLLNYYRQLQSPGYQPAVVYKA